jgi:hypothetical protein
MSNILAVTYDGGVLVTPSDTTDDPNGPFAGLHTGAGGDIKIIDGKGATVVLYSCAAGIELHVACRRVWSTGTATPSKVTGLYANPFKGAAK